MQSNKINFKKVVFIGLGYIGLPSAAVISSRGITVGVDNNPYVIETINSESSYQRAPIKRPCKKTSF